MSNTNTIFGWVLFSGIVGLGLTSVSSKYFGADHPSDHGEPGYVIDVADSGGAAAAGPSLAELLATGDAAAGAASFAKCQACHTIDQGGAAGIGPNLFGVVGTTIGHHAPGFAYSSDLAGHGGDWTYENLDHWLTSPRAFAAGTKMSFPGLSDAQERANVILYLRSMGGGPDLPAVEAAPAAEEGAEAPAEGEADAAAEAPAEEAAPAA
ncbi:MAG: cytochrome c family protein [Erythrobacter sp.]|nr:cytochrome c family protein [Erythrobacter sp.]